MKEKIIKLEDVCFFYGAKQIVDRVSFTVCKGEKIGILGESGCGKSTLLSLLAGLYSPSGGSLKVAGESEPDRICEKVSIVMQSPMLLPMTIYENITLGHEYSKDWIDHVLKLSCLDGWIDSLKDGVYTYLGDRANELSGGQAQRIAIARAMCKDSEVILLDEPTSALDPETGLSVMEALKNATKEKTVIHVTHRQEHLESYTRVYRMQDGKLVQHG